MKVKFLPSLLMFISAYFPLALIFIIKDLGADSMLPQHPKLALIVFMVFGAACATVLVAANKVTGGLPVRIVKVSNKSADMFSYTIPYMISFYNFNLGDWRTLLCMLVLLGLMFALAYRAQSFFVNPVLALAGFGLYDTQFKDGSRDVHGLVISKADFQVGDTCVVQQLSKFLYLSTETKSARTG